MTWVTVGVLVLGALAGAGIVAITTGRLPPLGRDRVLRPRLWGYGALVSAVGLGVFLFLGPFHGPDLRMAPYALSGTAVFLVGSALQMAARRPGRPATPPAS
ncbi:hypothetical protein OHB41_29635 [Streptomyces sp. NBC_01571]|uniref:hypothetical protein n=1 Tax=Streptomyces sp. NBC_01571 TaxID=2975883 RepID=UPI0022534A67|nr:hypothetical protein [Streptomyces sp. NBC_01571]MCX4577267.1 hypothetical protein [Streptomyces sp. NBC_01571]